MCQGTEAGMVNLRNKKMVAGRQESVRGQGTMKAAGAGALNQQEGTPEGSRTKKAAETDTHLFTSTPLQMHCPLPNSERELTLPSQHTLTLTAAKFGQHSCLCLLPSEAEGRWAPFRVKRLETHSLWTKTPRQ